MTFITSPDTREAFEEEMAEEGEMPVPGMHMAGDARWPAEMEMHHIYQAQGHSRSPSPVRPVFEGPIEK